MNKWRHSKRGLTLIEIMVMVIMVGVLALLGLRLYNANQQQKAKNAVIETIQNIEKYNAIVKASKSSKIP